VTPPDSRIRTVFDARTTAPSRFAAQVLLLAHSWSAWAARAPLEVFVLGEPPDALSARLRELGADVIPSQPHLLDDISKLANKLVGLQAPSDTPVLLVDNDTCFLDDAPDLGGADVRAAVANRARIDDTQWEHIAEATGLVPVARQWTPLAEELDAATERRTARPNGRLYLNSGVVWARHADALAATWARNIETIARAFDGHPLSSFSVFGCDQAGLATAVATGGFELLPVTCNYRPACFQLGLADRPRILHLSELGKKTWPPFSRTLSTYWERRILRQIKRAGGDRRERLLDEATSVRDRLLGLVRDAGLDALELRPATEGPQRQRKLAR
jgi:hypothetical protein